MVTNTSTHRYTFMSTGHQPSAEAEPAEERGRGLLDAPEGGRRGGRHQPGAAAQADRRSRRKGTREGGGDQGAGAF